MLLAFGVFAMFKFLGGIQSYFWSARDFIDEVDEPMEVDEPVDEASSWGREWLRC